MLDITGKSVSTGRGQVTFTRPSGQRVLMGSNEVTKAIDRYARRHNEYARTVRNNTDLCTKAIAEWCVDHEPTRSMR